MAKFIKIENHEILYSEDNWKTFDKYRKNIPNQAEEESDQDIVYCVKLKNLIGEQYAVVIINELNTIRKQFKLQSGDGYGHAFEIFAIAVLNYLDYDYTYNKYIVKGNRDGKIDAIVWKDDINKVFQIKLDIFNSADKVIMKKNYDDYIRDGVIENNDTEDLFSFCESNKEHIRIDKQYKIYTISNNGVGNTNYKPLDIYKTYFDNILFNKKNEMCVTIKPSREYGFTKTPNSDDMFAFIINAKSFIDDLLSCENINNKKENFYKYFYENVRGYLGTNKGMVDTIINEKSNFIKYNNGITITGRINFISDNCIKVYEPTINNGQQTILNLLEQYPNINDINILVLLKNEVRLDVKEKISRYTNTQKNIKPIDLISLNSNLRKLQVELASLINDNTYFLKVNTSGKRNYNSIVNKIFPTNKRINLSEFLKLYYLLDDKKIGDWKNNPSYMLEKRLNDPRNFDLIKSKKVCKIIEEFNFCLSKEKNIKEKNDMKVSNLAFMYIMSEFNYSYYDAKNIITKINNKYFYDMKSSDRPSKLIDIYKTNEILRKIQETMILENEKEECLC